MVGRRAAAAPCRGLLYRGTELDKLAGDGVAAFRGLGIRIVFDLRTEAERSAMPDRVPPGIEYVVCDVLADAQGAGPAQLLALLNDPKSAADKLGGGKTLALFENSYRQLVTLPSALRSYRQFFTHLVGQAHRPAYFHCTTGKDRTGWSALLDAEACGYPAAELSRRLLQRGRVAATPMTTWGQRIAPRYVRLVFSNEPVDRLASLRDRIAAAM